MCVAHSKLTFSTLLRMTLVLVEVERRAKPLFGSGSFALHAVGPVNDHVCLYDDA